MQGELQCVLCASIVLPVCIHCACFHNQPYMVLVSLALNSKGMFWVLGKISGTNCEQIVTFFKGYCGIIQKIVNWERWLFKSPHIKKWQVHVVAELFGPSCIRYQMCVCVCVCGLIYIFLCSVHDTFTKPGLIPYRFDVSKTSQYAPNIDLSQSPPGSFFYNSIAWWKSINYVFKV